MAAAAFVLYALTLTHGPGWDDAAELAAGVARLGVVHQTGYPLYVLVGKAFTVIEPFGGAATRANLFSAVGAAAAVGLLTRYVAKVTGSMAGGAVAGLLLATGPLFWYHATVASVYPMFVLSLVLLLEAGRAWRAAPSPRRLALLAAAAGLAFVSHKTGLVFAIAAVAFIARYRALVASRRTWLALGAALIPLATLAYVPLRSGFSGFPNVLEFSHGRSLDWVLGTAPGAPEAVPLKASVAMTADHAWRMLLLLLVSLSPAAIALVPLGVWRLRARAEYVWLSLAPALVVSAGVVTTTSAYLYWHLPLLLAGAVAAGAAFPRILEAMAGARRTVLVCAAVLLLAVVPAIGFDYATKPQRESSGWAKATLAALPRAARITSPWVAYTPLRSAQELDGVRRDIDVRASGFFWSPQQLRAMRGEYVVVVSRGATPSFAPVAARRLRPAVRADFKGLSDLRLWGLVIGDTSIHATVYALR